MSRTTLWVLAFAGVLLSGYLLLVGEPTDDEENRRLVTHLERSKVTRIHLSRQGREPIVITRSEEGWSIHSPIHARADEEAVEGVLSGAEFLEPLRTLPDSSNRHQLGLAPPKGRLVLEVGKRHIVFDLGRRDPSGQGIYLAFGRSLHLVDRGFADAVLQDLPFFRDRTLVTLAEAQLQRIDGRFARGGYSLVREEGRWNLVLGGSKIRARGALLDSLVGSLRGLQARHFLKPGATSVSSAEFASKVSLRSSRGQLTLQWGVVPCPGYPEELVVHITSSMGRDPLRRVCVDGEDLSPLVRTAKQLFDPLLTRAREPDLAWIEIQRKSRRLRLERQAGKWVLDGKVTAGQQQIHAWLKKLRAYQADPLPCSTERLAALGLFPKQEEARITLGWEKGSKEILRLGLESEEKIAIRRDTESAVLWLPKELKQLLLTDKLYFRSRRVLELSAFDIKRVVTKRGQTIEEVSKHEDRGWEVRRPVRVPADSRHMKHLLTELSSLRVEGYTNKKPAAGFPDLVITLTLRSEDLSGGGSKRSPEIVQISLWGLPGKTCIGRVSGAPLFVLSVEQCALLRARRVQLRLLDIKEAQLREISIQRKDDRLVVEKKGPSWYRRGGDILDSSLSVKLVELVKSFSALEALAYGKPPFSPLSSQIKIQVKHQGFEPQTCFIDQRGRAMVEGRPVYYAIDSRVINAIDGFLKVKP